MPEIRENSDDVILLLATASVCAVLLYARFIYELEYIRFMRLSPLGTIAVNKSSSTPQ